VSPGRKKEAPTFFTILREREKPWQEKRRMLSHDISCQLSVLGIVSGLHRRNDIREKGVFFHPVRANLQKKKGEERREGKRGGLVIEMRVPFAKNGRLKTR